jgi:hypothetical protein
VSHDAGQTVVTFLGQITDGEFAGDSATLVSVIPNLNILDCLTPQASPTPAAPLPWKS